MNGYLQTLGSWSYLSAVFQLLPQREGGDILKDGMVSELEFKWNPRCNLSGEKYLPLLGKTLSQMGISIPQMMSVASLLLDNFCINCFELCIFFIVRLHLEL